MNKQKRILVATLNWGLGHATRCMPIINELLKQGVEVIIASDGAAGILLKKEYPQLKHITLPAYNIHYRTNNMFLNIAPQLPKIFIAILKEYFKIQNIIKSHQIDIIISDNRFGCFSKKVHTIFITHQLNIQIPIKWLQKLVVIANKIFIQQFDTCWVPDVEGKPNLAGSLSHGGNWNNVKYIGTLSRLKRYKRPKKYDIAIILSGPEPQRTFLEEKLLQQINNIALNFVLIKGKTEEEGHYFIKENIEVFGYLTAQKINNIIIECDIVISRAGYSTIMDLVFLNKKAILIPTPGQTEQEYLASHFKKQGLFLAINQDEIDLQQNLEDIKAYKGDFSLNKEELLSENINNLLLI